MQVHRDDTGCEKKCRETDDPRWGLTSPTYLEPRVPDDRRHTLLFAARRFPDHTRISGGLGSRAAEGHQTGKVLVEGQGTHHGVQRCIQEVYFDGDGAFRTGLIESSPRGLVPREIAL